MQRTGKCFGSWFLRARLCCFQKYSYAKENFAMSYLSTAIIHSKLSSCQHFCCHPLLFYLFCLVFDLCSKHMNVF